MCQDGPTAGFESLISGDSKVIEDLLLRVRRRPAWGASQAPLAPHEGSGPALRALFWKSRASACNLGGGAPVPWGVGSGVPSDDEPQRAQANAAEALGQSLCAELPHLRSFLSRLAGGRASETDDLVQEVVARALRYGRTFDRSRALRPWLRSMAFRTFLDQRGQEQRHKASTSTVEQQRALEDSAPPTGAELESREEVASLLARLPAMQADILQRFHARGESVRDIARELSLPEGTVKSHLHRARRKLASATGPEDPR